MKWTLPIVGSLVLLFLGYYLQDQIRDKIEFKAKSDSLTAVAEELAIEVGYWQEQVQVKDSVGKAKSDSLELEISRSTAAASFYRKEARSSNSVVDSLVSTLPVEYRARVDSAVVNVREFYEASIEEKDRIIEYQSEQLEILDGRVLTLERAKLALERALEESNRQVEFYRDAASPGFTLSLKKNLPEYAAAFALGAITWELARK